MNESPQGLSKHIIRPFASLLAILILIIRVILALLTIPVLVLALPFCYVTKFLARAAEPVREEGNLPMPENADSVRDEGTDSVSANTESRSMRKGIFGVLLCYTSQFLWCLMFPIAYCITFLGCVISSPSLFLTPLLNAHILPHMYLKNFFYKYVELGVWGSLLSVLNRLTDQIAPCIFTDTEDSEVQGQSRQSLTLDNPSEDTIRDRNTETVYGSSTTLEEGIVARVGLQELPLCREYISVAKPG